MFNGLNSGNRVISRIFYEYHHIRAPDIKQYMLTGWFVRPVLQDTLTSAHKTCVKPRILVNSSKEIIFIKVFSLFFQEKENCDTKI